MTGLDKIIGKINADTESECKAIVQAAEQKCSKIISDGENEGRKAAQEIISAAQRSAEKTVEIAESSASQLLRQGALKAKVDVINSTLDEALDTLKNLPTDEYFGAVIKIAADNAIPGECKAKLSAADNGRLPSGFEASLAQALTAKGAKCSLSDESAQISSGLLLDYGDIVVNCSFEAIIEENADEYKAIISKILF
jgi:V/A-type H+-transporting ATPase subunit E